MRVIAILQTGVVELHTHGRADQTERCTHFYRIMDEKLGKRNSAAHPSSMSIGQLQTDAFIDDLVKNVVLKIH